MRKFLVAAVAAPAALALCVPSGFASDYYKVQVKRVSQDLYEVLYEDIYIKTRYCYEYTYGDDAILQIDGLYGYNIGKLIFVDSGGAECDVEKLIN